MALYLTNLEILLSFSIYYLLHSFVKNIKNYYLLLCIFIVLAIIFGGTLNTFFVSGDMSTRTIPFHSVDSKIPGRNDVLFPKEMFLISLIMMPFYGIGQQFTFGVTLYDHAITNYQLFFETGLSTAKLP